MKKIIISMLPTILLSFFIANQCFAADTLLGNIGCISDGNCSATDIRNVIINLAGIILAVTGSLSLLAFVIGGIMFLVSSGSSEMVGQAKKTITGAIIGMAIVFGSYTIITFVLKAMGINDIDLSIIK